MQLQHLYIDNYKNLKEFRWHIEDGELSQIICIVGQNGAGKSNLLEAIIHIFNCLNFSDKIAPEFSFEIHYKIDYTPIKILGSKGNKKGYLVFIEDEEVPFDRIKQISKTWISAKHSDKIEGLLPENVIAYYSGYSTRVHNFFTTVNKEYTKIFRQGKSMGLPPLLLIQPFHFKMILLALFSFDKDVKYIHNDFLKDMFGIEGFVSVALHLQKHTNWIADKQYKNFFDTKGVIRNFLFALNKIQLDENEELKTTEILSPPFKEHSKSNPFLVNKVIYFLKSHNSIANLKREIGLEAGFFKLLNILYQSGYLSNIIIMIKKEGVEEPISFDELSEGEQQLLAIKGCIELLRGKNNLFLWDEPDTYLNARWQWNLIPDLEKQITNLVEDQFILTTHSPVLLSTNKKGVYEMRNGSLSAITGTYGLSVNDTLSKQDISIQVDEVKEIYNRYLTLIQQGKGIKEEAITLRNQLAEKWGVNHPDLIKADIYLKYYK